MDKKHELVTICGVRGFVDENGVAQLNAEDVARGWGFVQTKSGKEYVRWETVNGYLEGFGFSQLVGKDDFIPENMVYRLGFKASNEAAQVFQAKLADEILPTIRKTGVYSVGKILPNNNDRAKRDEAMLYNARARAGKMLRDLASMTNMPHYKEILVAKAANIITGEDTLPLPKAESRKTYTAEQLCIKIGKSKNWRSQLGKVLKQNGMEQTESNGYFTRDEVNGHECKVFNWYADIILPKLYSIFPQKTEEA